jgi:hypothetical protein
MEYCNSNSWVFFKKDLPKKKSLSDVEISLRLKKIGFEDLNFFRVSKSVQYIINDTSKIKFNLKSSFDRNIKQQIEQKGVLGTIEL